MLLGGLLFRIIPAEKQPDVKVPQGILYSAVCGTIVFSFYPLVSIARSFSDGSGSEFWRLLWQIVLTFDAGDAWRITVVCALGLLVLLQIEKRHPGNSIRYAALALAVVSIFALGWSSHVSSYAGMPGFLAHTVHFLAVSLWVGVVLTAGRYAVDHTRWIKFLNWFTPLAVSCVAAVICSGLVIMSYLVPEYVHSWILPYGQALLLKHLLLIPLLAYGFINGFLMRARIRRQPDFNPKMWLRAEGLIALGVFSITAFMSHQAPPHLVRESLDSVSPSSWFLFFQPNGFQPNRALGFDVNSQSLLLACIAILLFMVLLLTFVKSIRVWVSLCISVLFVVVAYAALMIAIH